MQITGKLQYCTVSHRRGHAELPKLETTNASQLTTSGIAIDELPESYREAITIAESLDISYIWIDSLCIMQDSILDWRNEAGAMCDVYRGAEVNIALAAGSSGSKSVLSNRDTSLIQVASTGASWIDGDNDHTEYIVVATWLGAADFAKPLRGRAWVFQELRLATRVIGVGSDQIYYVCKHATYSETWRGGISIKNLGASLWNHLSVSGSHKHWQSLVKMYAQCDITRTSDTTMAIAGLARWYGEQLDDEYVAGMWRKHLPSSLAWSTGLDASERAAPYRAPTWSWLSVDGAIQASLSKDHEDLCDLTSYQVDLVDAQNPFGDIASGEIVLYGHITPVVLWGEAQNAMMAALECETGRHLAFGAVDAENVSCILTRDIQTGDEVDFNDIPFKPDGSEDSPLHVDGVGAFLRNA